MTQKYVSFCIQRQNQFHIVSYFRTKQTNKFGRKLHSFSLHIKLKSLSAKLTFPLEKNSFKIKIIFILIEKSTRTFHSTLKIMPLQNYVCYIKKLKSFSAKLIFPSEKIPLISGLFFILFVKN